MDITQIIGIAAGVLTSIAMLPQLIKIFKEKKSGKCLGGHVNGINSGAFFMGCLRLYAGRSAHYHYQLFLRTSKYYCANTSYKVQWSERKWKIDDTSNITLLHRSLLLVAP